MHCCTICGADTEYDICARCNGKGRVESRGRKGRDPRAVWGSPVTPEEDGSNEEISEQVTGWGYRKGNLALPPVPPIILEVREQDRPPILACQEPKPLGKARKKA